MRNPHAQANAVGVFVFPIADLTSALLLIAAAAMSGLRYLEGRRWHKNPDAATSLTVAMDDDLLDALEDAAGRERMPARCCCGTARGPNSGIEAARVVAPRRGEATGRAFMGDN